MVEVRACMMALSSGEDVQTTGANVSCRKSEVMLTSTCIGLGVDWCVFILFTIILSWRINPQLQLSSIQCSSLSHSHLPQIYLRKVSPLIHKDFSLLQHASIPSSTSIAHRQSIFFSFLPPFFFSITIILHKFISTTSVHFSVRICLQHYSGWSDLLIYRTSSVFLSLVPFLLFRLQSFFCILRRSSAGIEGLWVKFNFLD